MEDVEQPDGMDDSMLWHTPLPVLAEPLAPEDIELDMQLQVRAAARDNGTVPTVFVSYAGRREGI